MKKLYILLIAVLLFSGCSSNPLTGKSTMAFVSNSELFPSSFAQYEEFLNENTVVSGTADANMVARVRSLSSSACGEEVFPREESFPIKAEIDGVLRGLLPSGIAVRYGMKAGDVDPRCEESHCFTVSDKALAIGGGVLEAFLRFFSVHATIKL